MNDPFCCFPISFLMCILCVIDIFCFVRRVVILFHWVFTFMFLCIWVCAFLYLLVCLLVLEVRLLLCIRICIFINIVVFICQLVRFFGSPFGSFLDVKYGIILCLCFCIVFCAFLVRCLINFDVISVIFLT